MPSRSSQIELFDRSQSSELFDRSQSSGLLEPQLALQTVGEAVPQSPFQDAPPSLRQQELAVRRQLVKSQRRGDLVEQAACYLRLGDIQLSRGDSELAGDLYRQALKLSQTAHDSRQAVARSK